MTCTHSLANMAKKQRGKSAPSSKTADMKKQTEHFNLILESSDDEAPEEVTFEDSKAEALRSMKQALDTARRKGNSYLPTCWRKSTRLLQKEEQQEAEEDEQRKKKRKRSGKLAHARNLKGNYTVQTGKERGAASFQQQAAQDFLQSRMYGPGSCRSTSNELLSLQNKTGRNKSAAVQFVKKDWACDQKAKAEKLKKRWVHKQQIPSC
ncbi:hypothetical protein FQN60_016486 [Etheostoma spectabile]|uniref:U3 small nucleolar RNA-associated protein NOL7 C-terminal domain-containing protein n=1 Tax=Etheostoma spectabile TaxID=54343 RepID=A0A5J5D2N6_9PERO|nr:hypothetical protein FQN60_016486 [Etheostoma spectabile]